MKLTSEQIAELRRKAIAAGTEHPWHYHADEVKGDPLGRSRYEVTTSGRTVTRTYYSDPHALHEADFISTANPKTILALLDDLEEARKQSDAFKEVLNDFAGVVWRLDKYDYIRIYQNDAEDEAQCQHFHSIAMDCVRRARILLGIADDAQTIANLTAAIEEARKG